jgi:hypothetical protein
MRFEQPGGQIRHGMLTKVRRHLADANPVVAVPLATPHGPIPGRITLAYPRSRAGQLVFVRDADSKEHERTDICLAVSDRLDEPIAFGLERGSIEGLQPARTRAPSTATRSGLSASALS